MPATVENLRKGLNYLIKQVRYVNKKTQMDQNSFTTLISDMNVWLEQNDAGEISKEDDKKNLARLILHEFAANLIPAPNNKIGPYAIDQLPSFVVVQLTTPTNTNLNQSWKADSTQYADVRAEVRLYMGIRDTSHSAHGSNFSGTQTLRQIIDNLFEKVNGMSEITRVSSNTVKYYRYNPVTKI
jgi:hypothetical protein